MDTVILDASTTTDDGGAKVQGPIQDFGVRGSRNRAALPQAGELLMKVRTSRCHVTSSVWQMPCHDFLCVAAAITSPGGPRKEILLLVIISMLALGDPCFCLKMMIAIVLKVFCDSGQQKSQSFILIITQSKPSSLTSSL